MTTHAEVLERAGTALRARSAEFGLDPATLHLTYLLNPHNFGNLSFQTIDGDSSVHVKLAGPEDVDGLRKLMPHAQHLTQNYRAPRVLGWLDVPGTGFGGMVFEVLPGKPMEREAVSSYLPRLREMFTRLHTDEALNKALRPARPPTLREYWDAFAHFIAAPVADARRDRPPFVTNGHVRWMEDEAARLLALGEGFGDRPVYAPVHCDMWEANVLVHGDDWWVIDWDDLRLGDPAHDWGCLCLMQAITGGFAEASDWAGLEGELRSRTEVYYRGLRFFYCVDAINDWQEAVIAPEHTQQVRAEKEDQFAGWYDNYRETYG